MDEQVLVLDKRKNRKHYKKKKYLKIILFAFMAVLVLTGFVGYNYLNNYLKPKVDKGVVKHLAEVKKDKPINILVVGTDERSNMERARTDTIILFSIDNKKNTVKILSIPRDTYVTIPGRPGMDKINHAHAFGGMALAVDTIQKFTGQPIHYYVRTNFNGFQKIVDTLGGVDIYVDRDMETLRKGTQHLNGKDALIYVRQREGDPQADITRISRQQQFIKVLANEYMQGSNIIKLPQLLPSLRETVETNMSLTEMLNIFNKIKNGNSGNMPSATIPGKPIMVNGISYWQPDMEKTKEIINQTFNNN